MRPATSTGLARTGQVTGREVTTVVVVVVVAALLTAAFLTFRTLADIDPRGRASWTTTPIAFDATPRDLTLFLPACDVRAIVLHPAPGAHGRLGIDYVRLLLDRRNTVIARSGAGGATVLVAGAHPVTLPMGDAAPYWREAVTLRVRRVDDVGQPVPGGPPIALDPITPVTLDAFDDGALGRFVCAFDAGSRASAWTVVTATLVMLTVAGVLGAGWLSRALRPLPRDAGGFIGDAPHGPAPGTSARPSPRATAAALLLVAATVVAYSVVVPPFEPPDELAHLQYARFVAVTGTLPSTVPPPESEWRASSYEWVQQPLYYLAAATVLRAAGLHTPGPALVANPRSRLHPGGTEPTIFAHGTPAGDRTGHRALRLLRIVSLLMTLATTLLIARLVSTVSAAPLVTLTVAGGLGLIPQWCAVMGAVSTDPPATLLAAAATLAVVRIGTGRAATLSLLATGALIGAAYAAKATTVFLVPMALLSCVTSRFVVGRRREDEATPHDGIGAARRLARPLRQIAIMGAGMVLAAGWIPLRAWLVFGDPGASAFKRAVLEAGGFVPVRGPMPWTAEFWRQMQVMVFEPFWARFGSLGAGPFPGSRVWLVYAAASATLLGLAAWATASAVPKATTAWLGRKPAAPPAATVPVLLCALGVTVGLAAWAFVNLVPRADTVVHWTPRHILPLTAPAAVLVAAGLERLRQSSAPLARLAQAGVGLTIAALAVAGLAVLRATVLMFHFGF